MTTSGKTASHGRRTPSILISMLVAVLFGLAALLAYSNSFDVPFHFDDLPHITQKAQVRADDWSVDELLPAWQTSDRPVVQLSFALNHLVHGFDVTGYHVVNLVVHVVTGFLLYLLFRQTLALSGRPGSPLQNQAIAASAALLWLVHPLHTQSVTYVVQRWNSMAALFFVTALLLYIAGRQRAQVGWRLLAFTACAAAGLLAVGSKANAAILPLFLVLYEWYFFRNADGAWLRRNAGWFALAAVLVTACGLYLLSGWGDSIAGALRYSYQQYGFTMGERLLTELRVVVHYFSLIVYPAPSRLHLDYDFALSRSLLDPVSTLLSLLAIGGALAWACLSARSHRILSFAIFWYLGNLVIESSIIALDLVFEHRTYLPSMFLFLAATSALFAVPVRRNAIASVVLALAAVCVFWTHERNDTWRDPVRFWSDNVAKAPGSVRSKLSLGKALRQRGQVDAAIAQYRAALALKPSYYKVHYNLGNALYELGRHAEAEAAYRNAVRLQPGSPKAHYNLGNTLLALGRPAEAGEHYRRATELDPTHSKAHYNLAVIMLRSGRPDAALPLLERTIELEPGKVSAHYYLGRILALTGERERAMDYLRRTLQLKPDHAKAQALLSRLEAQPEPPHQP